MNKILATDEQSVLPVYTTSKAQLACAVLRSARIAAEVNRNAFPRENQVPYPMDTNPTSDRVSDDKLRNLFSMFRPSERVYVLIDGSNTYSAAKALNFSIDFGRMRQLFDATMHMQRIYYFTALPAEDRHSWLRRQVDWMMYNGYTVIEKRAKEYINGPNGETTMKGNVDVELAVWALTLCDDVEHFVLMTGDGDFRSLVQALQTKGKRVTAISTTRSRPALASDDLRKQVDFFIDLDDLRPFIMRTARVDSTGGGSDGVVSDSTDSLSLQK